METDYTRQLSSIYLKKRTLPSIIFWTSMFLATLVDSILVSNYYGAEGLTIVSVFAPIITIWWIFAAGLGVGGSALFSKLQGNNERAAADKLASNFNGLALVIGLVLGVIGISILPWLCVFLVGDNAEVVPQARQFGLWLMLTTPVMIYMSVLSDFVHADNAPKLAMKAIVVQNVLNILLDVLFMGVLDIGPQGASLALLIGTIGALGVILSHFRSANCTMTFRISLPKRSVYPQIVKYSYSAMLASTYDAITLIILNKLALDTFGLEVATVFFMTTYTVYLTRGPYVGISSAVMPVQAAFLGGGNNRGVKIATMMSIRTCILIVSALAVVLLAFPNLIAVLYNFQYTELLDKTAFAVRIVALSLIFRAVNYILYNSYIAVGHSGFSLFISTLRSVVLPVAVGVTAVAMQSLTWFLCGALIAEAGTFVICLTAAYWISKRKRTDSILFLPRDNDLYMAKHEMLLTATTANIRDYTAQAEAFLNTHHVDSDRLRYTGLALEELILYCLGSKGFKEGEYIYIEILLTKQKQIRIITRFDANAQKIIDRLQDKNAVDDNYIGLRYLYNKSKNFVYNRVLGLNNIDLTY